MFFYPAVTRNDHLKLADKRTLWGCLIAFLLAVATLILNSLYPLAAADVRAKEPATVGSEPRFRLLTTSQYINTLAHLFGDDIEIDSQFAPLQRTDGLLALGASTAGLTDAQMELYQRLAAFVAEQIVGPERRGLLIPCKPISSSTSDHACATKFLRDVSRRLYRSDLDEARLAQLVDEADAAAVKLKDFYAGLATVLEGILVSPNVLFVNDLVVADPDDPTRGRLNAYSLATRLSLFLWDAAPDESLLRAAARGDLSTQRGLTLAVDQMLASPRLEAGMRAFFDDMFGFEKFDALAKDALVYPAFTGLTAADAREQTLRTVIAHTIDKKADYRDLFTTPETFMSPALAVIYGVPAPASGWKVYSFPADGPRNGLLSHVSFLAAHSHPGRSSATLRGKAIRELLLCQKVPDPPANVDFSALENPKATLRTARDRVNEHLQNPVCAGCHRITDPIGLGLENFDGSGRYREAEQGAVIDPSGALDGISFRDVPGLGQALHDHPAVPACLVRRLYSYAVGTAPAVEDRPLLNHFEAQFAERGYNVPALLRTIVLSKAFSHARNAHAPLGAGKQTQSSP